MQPGSTQRTTEKKPSVKRQDIAHGENARHAQLHMETLKDPLRQEMKRLGRQHT